MVFDVWFRFSQKRHRYVFQCMNIVSWIQNLWLILVVKCPIFYCLLTPPLSYILGNLVLNALSICVLHDFHPVIFSGIAVALEIFFRFIITAPFIITKNMHNNATIENIHDNITLLNLPLVIYMIDIRQRRQQIPSDHHRFDIKIEHVQCMGRIGY